MTARPSRRTGGMDLTIRQRALLLLDALHTDRDNAEAVWLVWDVAGKLGDQEYPRDEPLAAAIWSARCRGVAVDAQHVARACACSCQRDLRLLHVAVADALDRPLPPPSTVAAVVPAPAGWPGGRGGAA